MAVKFFQTDDTLLNSQLRADCNTWQLPTSLDLIQSIGIKLPHDQFHSLFPYLLLENA